MRAMNLEGNTGERDRKLDVLKIFSVGIDEVLDYKSPENLVWHRVKIDVILYRIISCW